MCYTKPITCYTKLGILPPKEREDARCEFCGDNRSVRYKISFYELDTDKFIKSKPACNLCALVRIGNYK